MFKPATLAAAIAVALAPACALAADNAELQQLHQELDQLRQTYETRIQALETRLKQAEGAASSAQTLATQAKDSASETQSALTQVSNQVKESKAPAAGTNAFNPDISLVLSGLYSNLSKDPANYRIKNFASGDEIGPGSRGFNLTESELGVSANIDPWFYGAMNFSIHSDNTVSAEEAFVQTTALPDGVKIKAGRFFSGIGYLNEQHSHTWDFVDAPLAYQAFLGSQFSQDGVQMKWLVPSDHFLEIGSELGAGNSFPGSDHTRNGAGAASLFAHAGGDIGFSNSWRAGISLLRTHPQDRSDTTTDLSGNTVTNSFTGDSQLWLADFVWKWAPNGNGERTNLKVQGEYFHRREDGSLTYDTSASAAEADYRSAQSGWYLQSVYQFMPTWRVGARYDRLDSGSTNYGSNSSVLANDGFTPHRSALMFDWTPSEFSRIRLQLARDHSTEGSADKQIFLQYQMSLGAHGAHIF
jgi:hypothetical protein